MATQDNKIKYLSDNLFIPIPISGDIEPMNYKLYRISRNWTTESKVSLFNGRILTSDDEEKPLYITDLISPGLVYFGGLEKPLSTTEFTKVTPLTSYLNDYEVDYTTLQGQAWATKSINNVMNIYMDLRIPPANKNRFIDLRPDPTGTPKMYNLLKQRTNILPRIPNLNKYDNFWVSGIFCMNGNLAKYLDDNYQGQKKVTWAISDKGLSRFDYISSFDRGGSTIYWPINEMKIWGDDLNEIIQGHGDVYNPYYLGITVSIEGIEGSSIALEYYTPIAILDNCPAEYYLCWIDRTGAYMSMPFNKRNMMTENVTHNLKNNLLGQSSPYSQQVQYKWTLNSDWLTVEEQKAYESILVSPQLYLYDTKLKEGYYVNCINSSWEEKTFKNTKKPFNLKLDLQYYQNQNIIQ